MKKKNKIEAFTLAEMIVVLVVSSIVIATGFLVLQMARQQIRVIQKNYYKKQEVSSFENILYRDFSSKTAKYNPSKQLLILKSQKDSILYQFKEKYITRNKDTFEIEANKIITFLDGNKATNNSIDAIQISLSENFSNVKLFLQQTKDASHYINQ